MQALFLTRLRTAFLESSRRAKPKDLMRKLYATWPFLCKYIKCFRIAFAHNLHNSSSLEKKNPTLCRSGSPKNSISLLFQENRNRQIQDNN